MKEKSSELLQELEKKNAQQVELVKTANKETNITHKGKIHFPEYWAKRKNKISKGLMKVLQTTADAEPEVTDAFGEYKRGTFLHRACVVTITREDGNWNCHIFSEAMPITLPLIQEVRDKFLPNDVLMVQLYPSREERKGVSGVILFELPNPGKQSEEAGE